MERSRGRATSLAAVACLLLAAQLLAGCAATPAPRDPVNDPWEGWNRGVFAFNETVDKYFLEPVAKGYDFVVPGIAQTGIDNFFDNLDFPIRFLNNLLQGKPAGAGEELAAFLVNSTFGIGGLIDTRPRVGLTKHDEDFGQTLGVWGVAEGPYLVLPFLGPSNPRDVGGLVVDTASQVHRYFTPLYVNWGASGLNIINSRSLRLEEIARERRDSLDFYSAVRNAFTSNRRNLIHDGALETEETDDDLYYIDP